MRSTLWRCMLLLIFFDFFTCGRPLVAQQAGEICLQPIRLDQGNSAILGAVVDDNKQPVAGAEIYALGGEPSQESRGGGAPSVSVTFGTTESGESGEFLIIVPFTGTQIRIRATRWGFGAAEQSVTVGDRQIVRVQIVLHRRVGATQGTPNTALQTIYFATDRMPTNAADPEKIFGTDRSGHLNYGVATVAVPAPAPPKVASFGVTIAFMDNPTLDTKLEKLSETHNFWNDIRTAMAGMKSDDLYVFVHGYNNTFDEAARRAALVAYAAHLPGPMILYSWPSQGSPFKYTADETNVKWTQVHFHTFLDEIARQTGAHAIHLIAHSMGNRAVLDALEYFANRSSQPHFGQVILAAPDVDRDTYREMASEIATTVEHITLYGSANDQAIRLSKSFHSYPRAGDGGERIPVVPRPDKRIDAIDASAVPADLMGHAYLETKDILSDIQAVEERKYPQRDHLTPSANQEGKYWVFNP